MGINFSLKERSSKFHSRESVHRQTEKRRSPGWFWLLIFTVVLRIVSIAGLDLSVSDTARVAGIAREMVLTNDYLVPHLNGQDFLEYPPLGYWPIAFSLSTTKDPCDFLATLPIALLGTGTVMITFLIGKTLAGESVGLAAGFILTTMVGFFSLHKRCVVDPTLLFFVTLSLYGFISSYQNPSKRPRFLAMSYLAAAAAFLSKGMIGAAIPVGTALLFLIVRRDLSTLRKLHLGWGILLFLAPIALWISGVWWTGGPGAFKEVVRQSLVRGFSSSADHARPLQFHFYVIPLLARTLPWTVLPLALLYDRWKDHQSKAIFSHSILFTFSLAWFLTVFVGLSIASAKRALYLAPIYPSVALLAALGWNHLREKFKKVRDLETYGLLLILIGTTIFHFAFSLPLGKKESLRPIFDIVKSQESSGPVYLYVYRGSETLKGAAVFYLGRRIPAPEREDFLQNRIDLPPGTIVVTDRLMKDPEVLTLLGAKGFRLIAQNKVGRETVQIYLKSPQTIQSRAIGPVVWLRIDSKALDENGCRQTGNIVHV